MDAPNNPTLCERVIWVGGSLTITPDAGRGARGGMRPTQSSPSLHLASMWQTDSHNIDRHLRRRGREQGLYAAFVGDDCGGG